MMFKSTATALMLLGAAVASPIVGREATKTQSSAESTKTSESSNEWSEGWTKEYPIHRSCNATLHRQLSNGLNEAVQLAQHAKDHLLRFGHDSEYVTRYFGNGSTATPIGWYDRIINADKTGILFRCDDPDKNCATQDQWAGHWRGENATAETVICPLSFEIRRNLDSVCNLGYTVTASKLNTFWASDLMHRILHVPIISEEIVDHFAHDYSEVLSLAKEDPEKSGIDSNALQYFALDVYAYDIAAPGVGCTGEIEEEEAESSASATATATATSTVAAKASATSDAAKECHTHSDGVVHCS